MTIFCEGLRQTTKKCCRVVAVHTQAVFCMLIGEQATSLEPGRAAGPSEQRREKPLGRHRDAVGSIRQSLVDGRAVHGGACST